MEWDTAAGHAVLRGAGGEVVRFDDHAPFSATASPGFENPFFIAYAPGVRLAPPRPDACAGPPVSVVVPSLGTAARA